MNDQDIAPAAEGQASTAERSRRPAADRHIAYAAELLSAGRRPTLDLLIAKNGGSRTTANQALQAFWAEHVPALLAQNQSESGLPDGLREGALKIWAEAQKAAEALSEQRSRALRSELIARGSVVESQLQAIEAERVQMAGELERSARAAAESEALAIERAQALAASQHAVDQLTKRAQESDAALREATAALEVARSDVAESARRRAEATAAAAEQLDALRSSAQREVEAANRQAESAREALVQAHERAFAALKEAYFESETRLRVEVDQHKTRVKQLESDLRKVQTRLADADAALAAAEAREAAASRKPWKRPMLKRAVRRLTPP